MNFCEGLRNKGPPRRSTFACRCAAPPWLDAVEFLTRVPKKGRFYGKTDFSKKALPGQADSSSSSTRPAPCLGLHQKSISRDGEAGFSNVSSPTLCQNLQAKWLEAPVCWSFGVCCCWGTADFTRPVLHLCDAACKAPSRHAANRAIKPCRTRNFGQKL